MYHLVFLSSLTNHKDDGGRLDGVEARRRKRRNDEASTDCSADRNLRIHFDDTGIHYDHRFSLFWRTSQTLNKFHRSGQAVTTADVLLL